MAAEFVDHYDDLVRAGATDGARERLGSDDEFVARALARPELKSWSARWPWAVYGLGPIGAGVGVMVVTWLALLAVLQGIHLWFGDGSQAIAGVLSNIAGPISSVMSALQFGLGTMIGAIFVALAIHRRSRSPWVIVGASMSVALGGLLIANFDLKAPAEPGEQGRIQFGFGIGTNDMQSTMLRWAVAGACLVPLLWFGRRRAL